jgi:hypothetical protein
MWRFSENCVLVCRFVHAFLHVIWVQYKLYAARSNGIRMMPVLPAIQASSTSTVKLDFAIFFRLREVAFWPSVCNSEISSIVASCQFCLITETVDVINLLFLILHI